MSMNRSAVLALENGRIFRGKAFGAIKTVVGEAVFNTSMTGYQEIITDPSYFGQIVTLTTPQIGNYGINESDKESSGPKIRGLVIRELSPITSNWRSEKTLDDYLKENDVPGIEEVDTRGITLAVRKAGVMKCCLSTEPISDEEAVRLAREWKGLDGVDCPKEVSCKEIYEFKEEGEKIRPFTVEGTNLKKEGVGRPIYHIVAYDFGMKESILKKLAYHGFRITVVPADTKAEKVKALNPDGVFLSNGPGDPAALTYAHETVRELMNDFPIFGICLGHQIITHALGANTFKLKFGHRGGNHPVKNLFTDKVTITAQNHGYATKAKELERGEGIVTEVNLNDQTVSGLRHKTLPVFSVQYHPEAGPGPSDGDILFEEFYSMIAKSKEKEK
ncbi:MAG: carbamoyl phosphate synthase small subunit [Verrucomicrobia bacterium]|nr:MAG: carbamoyl phosphate synthase small subunit [Verrucomicrobiota bacterium]